MKENEEPEQKSPVSAFKKVRIWLLGSLLMLLALMLAALLLVQSFVDAPTVKKKIQSIVTAQIGGEFDCQTLSLAYRPWPTIELHQVSLTIPDQVQGKVATLRMTPALLPLLTGNIYLAKLELESPELSLNLPKTKESATPDALSPLEKSLAVTLEPLRRVATDAELLVNNGRLSVTRVKQKLVDIDGLTLQLKLSINDLHSARTSLQGAFSELSIQRNGHQETITGIKLKGSIQLDPSEMSISIDRLSLDAPNLELSGNLTLSSAAADMTLSLSGSNIDVDATRKVALALAGDSSPSKEIFGYLHGGRVPQISFTTRGETFSEMGDLQNIRIQGQLQSGTIAIPGITHELTEVSADLLIADGILSGSGMSARLEGSSGQDGTLKVGLTEDNDLFQLELMLDADLAQAQKILQGIVNNPAFNEELNRITNLQGAASGKLVLGDSLAKLSAKVDVSALNLTADYQRLPFPFRITSGKVEVTGTRINLDGLNGTVGDSTFTEVSGQIDLAGNGKGSASTFNRIELLINGTLGADTTAWLWDVFEVPAGYLLHTPLSLSALKIAWQPDIMTTFAGEVSLHDGPDLTFAGAYQADQLKIHKLNVKDRHSAADMALSFGDAGSSLNFSGQLQHETLKALLVDPLMGKGRIEGDLSVEIPGSDGVGVSAQGSLTGANLRFPLSSGEMVEVEEIVLAADGPPIQAELKNLSWNDYLWNPVKFTIDFSKQGPLVRVAEAKLCGIDSVGEFTVYGKDLALDFSLDGKGLDVASSYSCLTRGRVKMTGALDFSSRISSQGLVDDLVNTLQGPLQMTFTNGVIEQGKALANILEVLNVTEIVKGRLPTLGSTGFAYKTISLRGQFRNGKLLIETLSMDGETLDLLGSGEIDMEEKTVNVELLAAPFKTVDSILKYFPGANYLLGGGLVTIPISIKGDLNDPVVRVMSASSVGTSLLNLWERTYKSPLKLIDSFIPANKKPVR